MAKNLKTELQLNCVVRKYLVYKNIELQMLRYNLILHTS